MSKVTLLEPKSTIEPTSESAGQGVRKRAGRNVASEPMRSTITSKQEWPKTQSLPNGLRSDGEKVNEDKDKTEGKK